LDFSLTAFNNKNNFNERSYQDLVMLY